MIKPDVPFDETERLAALREISVLDTPAEEEFDSLARLAIDIFEVPIALVSLVDEGRQWFKACFGLDVSQTDRSVSFCGHAILGDDVMVVEDASDDPRFADNPLVTGEPHIRFYAGAPLEVRSGHKLGTLCIIDRRPRHFSERDSRVLQGLAAIVSERLDLKKLQSDLTTQVQDRLAAQRSLARTQRETEFLRSVAEASNQITDSETLLSDVLRTVCSFTGWPLGHVYLREKDTLFPTDLWHVRDPARFGDFRRVTELTPIRVGEGMIGKVAATKSSTWLTDVHSSKDFTRNRAAAALGTDIEVRAAFAFPVLVEGEVIAVLEFLSDQNEAPDQRLLALMDRLGDQVGRSLERAQAKERLAEVHSELVEARRVADQANEAKTRFISNLSHELRTGLNAVIGFSQLLEGEELPPIARESADQILAAGTHVLNLLNDMLDVARIEAGRVSLNLAELSLPNLINDVVNLSMHLAKQMDVTVESVVDPGARVFADEQRVRQVVLNLVSNAIKYNRQSGKVEVGARVTGEDERDGAGDGVEIWVSDTGKGMDQDALAMLFNPFERVGAETTKIEGTGLGLTLTKALVEAMGGVLSVSSEPGVGSRFTVWLAGAGLPSSGARTGSQTEAGPLTTILYIEDNSSNIRLVERIFRKVGDCRLVTASTGAEGLAMLGQVEADLLLLDLHLPDIGGPEVLQRIRAEPRWASLPVVVLTADANPSSKEKLKALGADDYVTKPLDVVEFLDVVNRYLGGERLG